MLITPYLWILFPNIIWIYPIIILSWKINDNKCILSQLEEKLFGEIFTVSGHIDYTLSRHESLLLWSQVLSKVPKKKVRLPQIKMTKRWEKTF